MDKEFIHIIIPSSSYYVPYLSVLLVSILCNKNNEDNLFFHILTEDITEDDKRQINILKEYGDFSIEYIYPDPSIIVGIKKCISSYINNLCNYKLHIASLFPNLQKVIVLECDMVVLCSLKELYKLNISDTPFLAVKDELGSDLNKRFNIPTNYNYCNTGMFLANLNLWRKMNLENNFKKVILSHNEKLLFPDQDIFNIALYKDMQYLPAKWNIFANADSYKNSDLKNTENSIKEKLSGIIHYANPNKPWLCETRYSEYFWIYARKSPYYEKILTAYIQRIICQNLYYANHCYKLSLEYLKYSILCKICKNRKYEHYLQKKNLCKHKLEIAKSLRRGY